MTPGEPMGAKHRRRATAEALHGLMVQLRRFLMWKQRGDTCQVKTKLERSLVAGHKALGRWAAARVDADRKAGSEPSTPSFEKEGREPRPRHWDTLGDGGADTTRWECRVPHTTWSPRRKTNVH